MVSILQKKMIKNECPILAQNNIAESDLYGGIDICCNCNLPVCLLEVKRNGRPKSNMQLVLV